MNAYGTPHGSHSARPGPGTRRKRSNLAASLGSWSAAHRKTAIFGWLLLVVLAAMIGGMAGQKNLTNAEQGTGDSAKALQIREDAGIKNASNEMVLVRTDTSGGYRGAADAVAAAVSGTGLIQNLGSPLISKDHKSALVQFDMKGDHDKAGDKVQPVLDAVAKTQAAHPEAKIVEYGDASGQHWFNKTLGKDFSRAEITAVPLALGILLVAFAALLAAFVPVVLALTAFIAANGVLAVVSHSMHVDNSANSVMLLIGLAVGVDYCLFYLRREREERRLGRSKDAALRIAAATSGRSVLISGLTVMVAMAGMFLSGMHIFEGFAVATILVVAIAVVGSVTVLPAILSLLGDKVEFGKIPFLHRASKRGNSRFWGAVLRPVLARPGVSAVLAAGVLLMLAAPALGMKTQKLSIDQQIPPNTPILTAYHDINRVFPSGATPNAEVVVKAADVNSPQVRQAISDFKAQAAHISPPGQPVKVKTYPNANVATIRMQLPGDGTGPVSQRAVKDIRALSAGTVGKVSKAYVGGDLAFSMDFNNQLKSSILPVFIFVMGITFLLMLISFRSLAIALTSILLNLLSVGAAYGIMTAVFQHGWGDSLVNTHAAGAIESWLPLFVFVVLFGLSMDYHVFVVSRIREARDKGMATVDAVEHGIKSTAGVVTSAAVIMVAVFAVFGTLSMQDFKQMGVGLAVAVLLDATLVRAVLLPSVMSMLGERNWYLPRFLSWLPQLNHGEEPPPIDDTRPDLAYTR